jgi:glycosyl transferase family 25
MKFKIFVINLDSSVNRLNSMQAQCDRLGLKFERVSAVRGSELSEDDKSKVYSLEQNLKKYDKVLNDGEIGCYLSHIKCWKKLIEEELDYALVLEDDGILTDELPLFITKLAKSFEHWDYILLSHGSKVKPVIESLNMGDGLWLQKTLKLNSTTTGQFISFQGAQKLVSSALPIARPVDMDIQHWFEKSLRCFVVSPFPVISGSFSSDINASGDRDIVQKRPFKRIWQKIKFEVMLLLNRSELPDLPLK